MSGFLPVSGDKAVRKAKTPPSCSICSSEGDGQLIKVQIISRKIDSDKCHEETLRNMKIDSKGLFEKVVF